MVALKIKIFDETNVLISSLSNYYPSLFPKGALCTYYVFLKTTFPPLIITAGCPVAHQSCASITPSESKKGRVHPVQCKFPKSDSDPDALLQVFFPILLLRPWVPMVCKSCGKKFVIFEGVCRFGDRMLESSMDCVGDHHVLSFSRLNLS